jgi:hypothetical protein
MGMHTYQGGNTRDSGPPHPCPLPQGRGEISMSTPPLIATTTSGLLFSMLFMKYFLGPLPKELLKQKISLHTPHPDPLPHGEREFSIPGDSSDYSRYNFSFAFIIFYGLVVVLTDFSQVATYATKVARN